MTSGTGTCSVRYDQAGSANYNAAPQVVESVSGAEGDQTIAVTTHAPASAVFGTSFGVAANAPGGAVTFSSVGACSNSGSTFTMTSGTGTCSVRYDQAGSANYNAAPQVVESVTRAEGEPDDHGDDARAGERGVRLELLGGGDRAGRRGDVLERGRVLELGQHVHDDERHRDVLGAVRPGGQRGLQRGAAGRRVGERAEGVQAIAVTTHAPASAVFGASFAVAANAPGGAVTFSSAASARTRAHVHDDERDGDVLGEVRPGRERELQRGAAGRRVGDARRRRTRRSR